MNTQRCFRRSTQDTQQTRLEAETLNLPRRSGNRGRDLAFNVSTGWASWVLLRVVLLFVVQAMTAEVQE